VRERAIIWEERTVKMKAKVKDGGAGLGQEKVIATLMDLVALQSNVIQSLATALGATEEEEDDVEEEEDESEEKS
jgi:hypothetical protein